MHQKETQKKTMYNLVSAGAGGPENEDYKKVGAWFLGPKAENKDLYLKLLNQSIEEHMELRESYYPDEEPYIDETIKNSAPYQEMRDLLSDKRTELSEKLRSSVPFFSQRYQAHMNWDTLMAGSLGYLTAILYNQNNVATEASPVTSVLEKEVGQQLCTLLGYDGQKSWGHITADGTIANIEAMWAARNLKAYPLAIREMLVQHLELSQAKEQLKVQAFTESQREDRLLVECSNWQLLNLDVKEALGLLGRISEICNRPVEELNDMLKPHLLATRGIASYVKDYPEFAGMKVIVPATHHYSWPKAATLLGLGQAATISIPVDETCKMDMAILEQKLLECLEENNPVLMVVAVIGSTAEGAVDPVTEIHSLKQSCYEKGLNFILHCDAAWGGYLRSMLVSPPPKGRMVGKAHFVPNLPLSSYAIKQFEGIQLADTVTVDPHKAGYIPYAAGALCYRNSQLRHLITFNAAYIHSDEDTNMGIYGVEGSKPGAAAAAVWLAHQTVPLDQSGYGQILGECSYSSKLYYCYWSTLQGALDLSAEGLEGDYAFHILPLIPIPSKIDGNSSAKAFESQEEVVEYINGHIIGKDSESIAADPRAMLLLENVGSDVLMNTFVVNFSKDGVMNTDYRLMNRLNENIFNLFSITTEQKKEERPKFVLMMNTLSSDLYNRPFKPLVDKWKLNVGNIYNLNILVNTVLQPWPNSKEFVTEVMDIFKEGVTKALGQLLSE